MSNELSDRVKLLNNACYCFSVGKITIEVLVIQFVFEFLVYIDLSSQSSVHIQVAFDLD